MIKEWKNGLWYDTNHYFYKLHLISGLSDYIDIRDNKGLLPINVYGSEVEMFTMIDEEKYLKFYKPRKEWKTLEELGFYVWFSDNKEITIYTNYTEGIDSLNNSIKILFDINKNIYLVSEYFVAIGQELISVEIDEVLHKAIELKMIELGLWEEV